MATTYLTRTFGTATNRLICTVSMWVKRSNLDSSTVFWNSYNSGTYRFQFYFDNSNRLGLLNVDSGSNNVELITNRLFRDVSAWYHIQAVIDTTQGTAANRVKIYVNGVQETSFATETYPSQNADMSYGASSYSCQIGRYGGDSDYFDGSMSHVHFIDGTAYDATAFGEFDANGVWTIKTSPSVTYGNEGFFILKDGNSVTDQSGNSNNFTVSLGTLSKTEDNPSNVFATLNNLDGYVSHMIFSHGNNTVDNGSTASNKSYARSTLGMSSGKFYFEAKDVTNANYQSIGITDKASGGTTGELGGSSADYVYRNDAGQKGNNNSFSSYGNSYTTNDIIGCAVDLDNLKIYFSKNGVWQNSGDPESGATGTGAAFTITAPSLTSTGFYFFGVGDSTAANSSKWSANFGNGYFGTTAVSSAGTNASGIGIFEYDVPTGYTALSTKGLNL
jgi:hypothetical protein